MFAVNIHHLSPAYTAVFVYLHDPPKRCKRALRKSAVSLIIPHSHIAFLHINRDGKESGFFPSLFSDMGLILTNPLIAWVLSFSDRARYSCREKRRFCRPDRAGSRLPRCPFCRRRAQHDLFGQRAVASAAAIYHDHISLLRHVDRLMEKEIVADRRFHRGERSVPLPVRQSPDSSFHLQCLNDLFPCLNAHLTHRLDRKSVV